MVYLNLNLEHALHFCFLIPNKAESKQKKVQNVIECLLYMEELNKTEFLSLEKRQLRGAVQGIISCAFSAAFSHMKKKQLCSPCLSLRNHMEIDGNLSQSSVPLKGQSIAYCKGTGE